MTSYFKPNSVSDTGVFHVSLEVGADEDDGVFLELSVRRDGAETAVIELIADDGEIEEFFQDVDYMKTKWQELKEEGK